MKGRQSRIDMSSEAGRLLLKDLVNFKETGFNPFIRRKVLSEKFWKSRKSYQKISFGAFKTQAAKMAEIATAQMPAKERKAEEARLEKRKSKKEKKKSSLTDRDQESSRTLPPTEGNEIKTSLRDAVVAMFPNGNKVFVLFEPDGNVDDPNANRLEFSKEGRKIIRWGRVPKEWSHASTLIGNPKASNANDGDCMLFEAAIQKRVAGMEEDKNGKRWEVREVIELPFPCHQLLFNKHGDKISSYLLCKNAHDYSWGYYWLLAKTVRVGLDDESSASKVKGENEDWDDNDEASASSFDEGGFEDISVSDSSDDDDPMNLDSAEEDLQSSEEAQTPSQEEAEQKASDEEQQKAEDEEQRAVDDDQVQQREAEQEAEQRAAEERESKRIAAIQKEETLQKKALAEAAQRKVAEQEAREKAKKKEAERKAAEEKLRQRALDFKAKQKAKEEEDTRQRALEREAKRKAKEEEARQKSKEEEVLKKAKEEEELRKAKEEEAWQRPKRRKIEKMQ